MKPKLDGEYAAMVLPRFDLRKDAFERYLPVIAKAIRQYQTVIEQIDFPQGKTQRRQTAATFLARFNDAKLGYKRYHYQSYGQIPPGFDVDNLVPVELAGERILIQNEVLSSLPRRPIFSADHGTINAVVNNIKAGVLPGSTRVAIMMSKPTMTADYAYLQSLEANAPFILTEIDSSTGCCFLVVETPDFSNKPVLELDMTPEELAKLLGGNQDASSPAA